MNKLPQWQTGPAPKGERRLIGVFVYGGSPFLIVSWQKTNRGSFGWCINGDMACYLNAGFEPGFWSEIPREEEIEEHPQRTEEETRQLHKDLSGELIPDIPTGTSVDDPSVVMIFEIPDETSREMTVRDIIAKYLKEHGFDGLYCGDCGCPVGDLGACGCLSDECLPGVKQQVPDPDTPGATIEGVGPRNSR